MCDIAASDVPSSNKTRHVSIRVPDELYERLEALAAERDESVSQCVRRLLDHGSASAAQPATTLDDAIAALTRVRNSVAIAASEGARPAPVVAAGPTAGPTASPTPPPTERRPSREVNVHNAKSNLSRLLGDVGRGEDIVIVHAGSPRARLVAIDADDPS